MEGVLQRLVRYFFDCLEAQADWARAVNVLEQRDLLILPLTRAQQEHLGKTGALSVSTPEAVELGNRFAASGSAASLILGALFLVGRTAATSDRPERRFCAPLLEVPLTLHRNLADGNVIASPEESRFSVNYGLLAEILRSDEEDLQDRINDLAELVPDFPIDAGEFDSFWNGFRMIAAKLPLAEEPPQVSRRHATSGDQDAESLEAPGSSADAGADGPARSTPLGHDRRGLEMVDWYTPIIPKDGRFRLLAATAIILGRRSDLALSALEDLTAMAGQPLEQTAFACLFDPRPAHPAADSPATEDPLGDAFPLPLTAAQEAVIRSARIAPLTVVTGPPGTGKSYTIAAMVLDHLLRGRSVLVASHMDKAVEVVATMVEQIAGPFALARSGGRPAQRELADKINRLTRPAKGAAKRAAPKRSDVLANVRELATQLAAMERRYQQMVHGERDWSRCREEYQRLAPICPLPVHEISERTLRRARRAARWARGALSGEPGFLRRWWGRWQRRRALRLLNVPKDWTSSLDELEECLRVHGLWQTVRDWERRLRTAFPADQLWEEIARLQRSASAEALRLLQLTREAVLFKLTHTPGERQQLRTLRNLLRRQNRKLKQALREQLGAGTLLRAFPAWASTNRALGQVLPAVPALFDVVVIDEASQCDLAMAAVALGRAKRAVIVGDPQQLRHVCFLGRAREQASFVRHELPPELQEKYRYSTRSLFDVAADAVAQEHFFFLDEHFRSHPHIIAFSNRHFYEDQLRIMTERPRREAESAIRVVSVAGRRREGTSINDAEVERVLAEVAAITAATPPDGPAPTLGIVCPFRDQVDEIMEQVSRRLTAAEIDRHRIVVGTAHTFQGDERDVVLFSTSIDPGYHPASLRFLENPNLFNVAVTRARRRLIIVTSVGPEDLPAGLLREFLEHARRSVEPHQPAPRCLSDFGETVAGALRKRGLDVWPQFTAAGFRLDLVGSQGGEHLAILCDGADAANPGDDPLNQHRILSRAGWKVLRVPYRSWVADWVGCVEYVVQKLAKDGGPT